MASPTIDKSAVRLTANMRRQLASEGNLRVLEALPAFRADNTLPNRLRRLLHRLEAAERRQPLQKS